MKGILTLLPCLMVFCGVSCNSLTVDEDSAEDNFDKALGIYAQGLLAFDDDRKAGVDLLLESIRLQPGCREFIDDYIRKVEEKILKETSLEDNISEFEKLHLSIINTLLPLVQKHPRSFYLQLKVIESCLQIDKKHIAEMVIHSVNDESDPFQMLGKLKYYRVTDEVAFLALLSLTLENSNYRNSCELQHYAMLAVLSLNDVRNQSRLLSHTLQLLKLLPSKPKSFNPLSLSTDLINGILYGSDIGEGAREQCIKQYDSLNRNRQWSLLAGILMKLNYHNEAFWVIKDKVLEESDRRWLALYNLSRCAREINKPFERLKYLEQSFRLKKDNSFLRRVLISAHTTSGDGERSLELLTEEKNLENDPWLFKIHYYNLKKLERFASAFTSAEKLYNWPDAAARMKAVTPSFATSTIEVYLEKGRPSLLMERLKLAVRYNPDDINLKNSIVYLLAEADILNEWMELLISDVMKKEPENPSYIDTLAWLRYKQKNYNESLQLINRALDLSKKDSGEVLFHAGEIYLANSRKAEAVKFWKRALKCDEALFDKVKLRLENENITD